MKTVWNLTVKTSLPYTCVNRNALNTISYACHTFQSAKNKLREILKELAFADNAMFDGCGYLKQFSKFIADTEDAIKDDDWFIAQTQDVTGLSDRLSLFFLKELHESLHRIFSGIETELPFREFEDDDCYFWVKVCGGCVHMKGYGEGPYNGIDPHIRTNMFDMSVEKDYMLYIDDYFCDQEYSSELYTDLKRTPFSE